MQLELPFLIEAPEAPAGTRVRRMTLGGRQIPYVFRRTPRRTIGIAVDERGLTAAAPRWVGVSEVEAFMREKENWILERLTEHAARAPAKFQWREGSLLPYLGCAVVLIFSGRVDAPRLRAGRLELPASKAGVPGQLREMTLAWLKIQALSLYRDRVAPLAEHGGVAVPLVQLSNARTQWGSCTTDGRVRLHWRLVHFGLPYIDYVIAHELAHLVELNHSRAFWRVVETMFPEYKAARAHLRAHGHLIPRL